MAAQPMSTIPVEGGRIAYRRMGSGRPLVVLNGLTATSADWQPGYTFQVTPVDTVTLYGLIDATLSSISNANAKGDHKTGFQTAWMSGNRWGITGRHGIFDNTTGIIFKLESEFDYQTGEEDTPGVLFNRDAWVGFQSDALGKLTFGRQNALARDFSERSRDDFGIAVLERRFEVGRAILGVLR